MYNKKKVYLKNTNRTSIKEITDFGMILRPYKLLVIAKVQDGDTPVNVDPCAVQGLNIWVKPEPHIRWAYWNVPVLVNTGTFLVYQYCLKM